MTSELKVGDTVIRKGGRVKGVVISVGGSRALMHNQEPHARVEWSVGRPTTICVSALVKTEPAPARPAYDANAY